MTTDPARTWTAPLPNSTELTMEAVAALCGRSVWSVRKWMEGRPDGVTLPSRKLKPHGRVTTAGQLRRFLRAAGKPVPAALRWRPGTEGQS